jgi:hypothetical protein
MEEHEANKELVNRTISKLLDFDGMPGTKKTNPPESLKPTQSTSTKIKYQNNTNTSAKPTDIPLSQTCWQQMENRSLEQQVQTNGSQIFVVVAWILLLLIVLVVIGNKMQLPLGLEVIEETYGNFFYISMLVLAGSVLSLTTWLYWKNKLTKTANIGVVIVIILSVSLPILTMRSSGRATGIGRLTRTLSGFPLTPTTSFYEPISGIIYSHDRPAAILGGRIVHEGDSQYGVKIIKIHKDKVEFEENGKRWIQRL